MTGYFAPPKYAAILHGKAPYFLYNYLAEEKEESYDILAVKASYLKSLATV